MIQFIICDCKGNDISCGFKDAHSLNMKYLCDDCDMKPSNCDNTCVRSELMCKFMKYCNIMGRTKENFDKHYFLPIKSCFHDLKFGGCSSNIYGAISAKILHATLVGLLKYIIEGIDNNFTVSSLDLISHIMVGMYEYSCRQSERKFPDLGPLRNALISVKSLEIRTFSLGHNVHL